ncbi:MAG: response regulator [Deltaproteobacteria bacterium]|nr:response regulator [Deltaproteobacteria bacterium]
MPLTILLVEDDAACRTSLAEALEFSGHVVHTAVDGQDALERLNGHPIDVVVTDLMMPRLGGLELIDRLGAHQPGLPVILVTAFANAPEGQVALDHGAFAVLHKPIDLDRLEELVERAGASLRP